MNPKVTEAKAAVGKVYGAMGEAIVALRALDTSALPEENRAAIEHLLLEIEESSTMRELDGGGFYTRAVRALRGL